MDRLRRMAAHLDAGQGNAPAIVPQFVVGDQSSCNASEQASFEQYCRDREAAGLALGNRGPLRFEEDGSVHKDIIADYFRCGFYVLEGAIKSDELHELQAEFETLLDNAPSQEGSSTDAHGRAVKFPRAYAFVPALSDPVGGTSAIGGRFTAKMYEPSKPEGAPEKVVQNIPHFLEVMESGVRVYGHPGLLRVAEAINGPDFTPFTENIFYKQPGLGGSVAWHQDPLDADWKPGRCEQGETDRGAFGFSFHVSLYHCTASNGLWMVPGSNAANGRIDVAELSARLNCGDRLPDAVPIVCKPGDVYIQSRQALHGSFPNVSPMKRCTLQFGFHRRSSVADVRTQDYRGAMQVYSHTWIREASMRIHRAIRARRRRYPSEKPYSYLTMQGTDDQIECLENSDDRLQPGYWRHDIII